MNISPAVRAARREMFRHGVDDPTYAEIMATYVELGELLDCDRPGPDFEVECRTLVDRAVALGKQQQHETDQREAIWWARHMESDG